MGISGGDFLNIDIENHVLRKKYFNPELSIKNTKLWLKNHKYQDEINMIERELSEFCYSK